jgi:ABC-type Mn2+/Zn2+ transport system permease subunit
MLDAFHDILTLFAQSFCGSLVVGAVCPLIGVFLLVRRAVFLGIAVPQFAAAGIAFGFLVLPWWHGLIGSEGHGPEAVEGDFAYHLFWALLFTLVALLILALLGRRESGNPEGRIAAGYAFAAAVTILFLSAGALGASHVQVLLRGEILALSSRDLLAITLLFGTVLLVLLVFRRPLLLSSFDREAAVSLGHRPFLWDILLYALMGASISVGVITVGPLVIFGLMVIPPLAARMLALNMVSFYLLASAIGLFTSVAGFMASFLLDWPLGPTDVVTAFLVMALILAGKTALPLLRQRS